nr:hypothetical protein [Aminobacter niigataensis]
MLERDVPVEIVAPVAVDTPEPFSLDRPFEPFEQGDGRCRLPRKRIRKFDPAAELQGCPLPGVSQFGQLVLLEGCNFIRKIPHRDPA